MSDQRLAEMISKIAHELRSPLTSIKGFSAMLVGKWDRFTDEQRFQFVETIAYDAERMSRIVGEVLDLARLESGRLELHATVVELGPLVEGVVAGLSQLSGIDRVEVDVPPATTVWADKERLAAIISNLLENALKFSDEGVIKISLVSGSAGAEISVSDHGVGIARDRVAGVFSGPAPAGGAATPSGTGLGLYLSRGLAEAHGGTLSVASKEGEGSTFTLSLPKGRADE